MTAAPEEWPVNITTACAEAAASAFGFPSVEEAKLWVEKKSQEAGVTTTAPPEPFKQRRSKSGYFRLVADTFLLPLSPSEDNSAQWVATYLLAFPTADQKTTPAAMLSFTKSELLRQINFTAHAVERFQQRCGGNPSAARAKDELIRRLAPTVRATQRPPSWARLKPADFYLVAGRYDQYCLPCKADSGDKPYSAVTCIHRAIDLFAVGGTRLRQHCELDETQIPYGSRKRELVENGFMFGGRLRWHRPRWVKPFKQQVWWIVFTNHTAVPVQWQPEEKVPLKVLDLVDYRPWWLRTYEKLRYRGQAKHKRNRIAPQAPRPIPPGPREMPHQEQTQEYRPTQYLQR